MITSELNPFHRDATEEIAPDTSDGKCALSPPIDLALHDTPNQGHARRADDPRVEQERNQKNEPPSASNDHVYCLENSIGRPRSDTDWRSLTADYVNG